MAELDERERRATVRLVNYWLSLQRSQGIPAFVDFDPHRNPIAWDQCLLASCGSPEDVELEHIGTAITAIDGETAMGPARPQRRFLNEILAPLPDLLRTGEPQRVSGITRLAGDRRLLYRSVLLPFRSIDPARHYVLGATTFKIEPATAMTDAEEQVIVEPARLAAPADAVPGEQARPAIPHRDP
jgi:hypothetical protein